ncbi:hypothetical protein FDUTEX481_07995 [Tolypothrix sp. PCC 7601]|nr:hypothetical protein FDUTEX481_07995 [Tolypothrix sp. PCC 7601]BAY89201.1 hypothetical protein NIES3275_12040 [Microchaete diplosiphon NIES-3275]
MLATHQYILEGKAMPLQAVAFFFKVGLNNRFGTARIKNEYC